ncbi:MAG: ACT domain-containing protein [bacterium]|nr:ACT domain-containing protein [Bacillota bacterium]HHW54896.1 ACT domain-containing protein [Bacillota bacterium]
MQGGQKSTGKRIIITVVGQDRIGIIAGVTNVLADARINILDISQTIMQEFFTMILVADMTESTVELGELKERLAKKGEELGVQILAQHEDAFRYMHRI